MRDHNAFFKIKSSDMIVCMHSTTTFSQQTTTFFVFMMRLSEQSTTLNFSKPLTSIKVIDVKVRRFNEMGQVKIHLTALLEQLTTLFAQFTRMSNQLTTLRIAEGILRSFDCDNNTVI